MENHQGSRLIKNSVFDLFNKTFMSVIGWAISIWIARKLGPNNYGIFTYILWFTSTFSVIIGMVAGAIPAYRASRLKPVDAIRYE